MWRAKVRDERTLQLVVIDPHSPAQFRADGAAINSDGFHDAFGTKPGDKMWKAPGRPPPSLVIDAAGAEASRPARASRPA